MSEQERVEQPAHPSGTLVIGVPRETRADETRVSLIPDTVKHLVRDTVRVVVETGAGVGSSHLDDTYVDAGAEILPDAAEVYALADIIVKVHAPDPESPDGDEIAMLRPGQTLISLLAPLVKHDLVRTLANEGVTALAMDAVPRITRAQSMDALSAMSSVGGYKAVIMAAERLPKFFPLLMTAAGTIRPARVLVLGAGVAGLQAIATARRLGAVVEAYDARAVVKEQVESLGAKFVEIDTGADAEGAGGYARQATEEELRRQQEGLNDHIARSDVVITTALVPGKPAPLLVPASAVERMHHGSVIVDMAAETGGNCELTVPGEVTQVNGVTIFGPLNLPATVPVHSSQMYSRVVQNFLDLLLKDGKIELNTEDEIIKGMCITHDGQVVQTMTRSLMGLDDEPAAHAEPESVASDDVPDDEETVAIADIDEPQTIEEVSIATETSSETDDDGDTVDLLPEEIDGDLFEQETGEESLEYESEDDDADWLGEEDDDEVNIIEETSEPIPMSAPADPAADGIDAIPLEGVSEDEKIPSRSDLDASDERSDT